jgi:uncharacterized repeat protein (TIGR01451 family)
MITNSRNAKALAACIVYWSIGQIASVALAADQQPARGLRTTQFIQQAPIIQSPEPPLADQGQRNVGPVPQPRLLTPTMPVPIHGPEELREDPPTPVVALRIRVPAVATAGQELEYRICIENLSTAPAHHVIVRNPLPANARFVRANPEPSAKEPELIWNLGTLAGCACKEIILVLSPTGAGDVQDCARVQFEHGQCVTTRIARPAIKVLKTGPAQAVLNGLLTFQLTVTNTGATELTGVVLLDKLPTGLVHSSGQRDLTWDLGAMAPGQSRSVDYQVTATSPGKLRNKAMATAAGGVRDEVEHEVQVAEVKIGLSMTGPEKRIVGAPTPYQITVSNGGTVPLTNVVISDPIPAQMGFVSAGNGGTLMKPTVPSLGPDFVQWAIGSLEPGASKTVDVVLRSNAAGRICNRARATANGGQTAQAEACTEFTGEAGLVLAVVAIPNPAEVDTKISYPITVRNTGFARVTNVRIKADVPTELRVSAVKPPMGSAHHEDGQIVTFDGINLEPDQEARYEITVLAIKAGNLRFKVEMYADQLTSGLPVYKEAPTTVANPLKNGEGNLQKKINNGT